MSTYEPDVKKVSDLTTGYEVGVLLAGFTQIKYSNLDELTLIGASNRLIKTMELYKAKKINKILIVGGQGHIDFPDKFEAGMVKEYLLRMGFKSDDILIENQSRNTAENAQFAAKLIKKRFPNAKLLLISSAHHLPRAKRCFEKVGLRVDIFPTDFLSFNDWKSKSRFDLVVRLNIPSFSVLNNWHKLIKEGFGVISYQLKGYI